MSSGSAITRAFYVITACIVAGVALVAQQTSQGQQTQGTAQGAAQGAGQGGGQGAARGQGRGQQPPPPMPVFPRENSGNVLRGYYSQYRANNDLLYYHL